MNIFEVITEDGIYKYKFVAQTIKEEIEKIATSVTATQKLINKYPLLKALYRIDGDKVNINYVIFSNDEFKYIAEEINLIFLENNPMHILKKALKNNYAEYRERKIGIKDEEKNKDIKISYDLSDEVLNKLRKELHQKEEEFNCKRKKTI